MVSAVKRFLLLRLV